MFFVLKIYTALLCISYFASAENVPSTVNSEISKFLDKVNLNLAELYNKDILASWQKETKGPNDLIALLQSEIATEEIAKYLRSIWPKVIKYRNLNISDASLNRELQQIPDIGYEALEEKDLNLLNTIAARMSEIYKNVQLCDFQNRNQCNLTLLPDIQNRLENSQNVDEIEYYWLEWRQKTGTEAKKDFEIFIDLYRKTAKLNGYSIPSDFWFKDMEEDSFQAMSMLENFFTALRPSFLQFHAHVRYALRKMYGESKIHHNKPYPESLAEIYIGRAFRFSEGQVNIEIPYPKIGVANVTKGLYEQGLNNEQKVFEHVVEYYKSLGMKVFEDNFWEENAEPKAIINQHYTSRICWHRAWRYFGLQQQSLSYCPIVNEENYFNMFEAVGELYYYRANQNQPTLFQEEPFPNFSESIGKMFALAASSPKFLESKKIIESGIYTKHEARMNRLYLLGLRTIFMLPVFYVLDLYRVKVLDNKIDINDNCAYWQLVDKYIGSEPPVVRSNNDFDAPAKLLIEVDDQYTSQIMSIVLQFQLLKHFCEITGQYERNNPELPLDLCDLSNQHEIGPLVYEAMFLGSSKSYKEVIKHMTNQTELKIDGLLEYFEPLFKWLQTENIKAGYDIGWNPSEACIAN